METDRKRLLIIISVIIIISIVIIRLTVNVCRKLGSFINVCIYYRYLVYHNCET